MSRAEDRLTGRLMLLSNAASTKTAQAAGDAPYGKPKTSPVARAFLALSEIAEGVDDRVDAVRRELAELLQTPPAPVPAPAMSPEPAAGAGFRSGDLVRIDGKAQVWRVVDFHGPLARVAPASPRRGRIVHPERLTRVDASTEVTGR